MSSGSQLAVVVPAYNAARFLDAVARRVLGACDPTGGLIVVDDGSSDATAEVAAALAGEHDRVTLVRRSRNGGYGAAVKDGLRAARAAGAGMVACVHADGQYAPEEIPRLLAELRARPLDLIQGSRIAGGRALEGGMPVVKYVANRVLGVLANQALGLHLSDHFSGCLVYGERALAEVPFERLSDSFDFDLEVLACAAARGLRIGELPIPTHYGDEVSYLRPVGYGVRALAVMLRFRRGLYGENASAKPAGR